MKVKDLYNTISANQPIYLLCDYLDIEKDTGEFYGKWVNLGNKYANMEVDSLYSTYYADTEKKETVLCLGIRCHEKIESGVKV
jgi:hypothetical protein